MYQQAVINQVAREYNVPSECIEITKWRSGPAPWMLFEYRPEATGRVRLYAREWEFVVSGGTLALYASVCAVVNDTRITPADSTLVADRAQHERAERLAARRAELRRIVGDRSVA